MTENQDIPVSSRFRVAPRVSALRVVAVSAVIVSALCVVVGCTESQRADDGLKSRQDVARAYISCLEQMVRTLQEIEDPDSARIAATKVQILKVRMAEMTREVAKFTTEQQQAFNKKYGERLAKLTAQISAEARRISESPEFGASFETALRAVNLQPDPPAKADEQAER